MQNVNLDDLLNDKEFNTEFDKAVSKYAKDLSSPLKEQFRLLIFLFNAYIYFNYTMDLMNAFDNDDINTKTVINQMIVSSNKIIDKISKSFYNDNEENKKAFKNILKDVIEKEFA